MKMGRETSASQKFANEGNNAAVNANRSDWLASRNFLGKSSLIAPMSLENLFNIRPVGFVSKNNTGA